MTLELTAASKGAAERKASQSGMLVNHATPMDDNLEEFNNPMALKNYRNDSGGNSQTKKLIIVLVVLAVLALLVNFVILPSL